MMKKILTFFKISSIIFAIVYLKTDRAFASEETGAENISNKPFTELINGYLAQKNSLDRVTSVSQLEDVQPTDWAFSALQSLIERYGAIAGYPDRTFRGNRAITRYEFAAGLNAALEKINELITTGSPNAIPQEDLATLERLRKDFAPELQVLRSRLNSLESTTNLLEAKQFSTTTKLNGLVILNLVAATANGDVKVERIAPGDPLSAARRGTDGQPIVTKITEEPNTAFSYVTALIFTTSFTGKDSLTTTLIAGNGYSPANVYASSGLFNTFGVPGTDFNPAVNANDLTLIESFYSFPVNNSLRVIAGPKLFWLNYFDTNVFTSIFGKGASSYNSFGSTIAQDLGRGAGAVVTWRLNEEVDLRFGYLASPNGADPTTGLFNGTRAFTTQLTYSPVPTVNLRLLYDRSRIQPTDGQIKTRPIMGAADDGFGGALEDATGDIFALNFDWLVTPKFGVFGRYSYTITHLNPIADNLESGSVKAQAMQFGLAFPDLGKRGALATLSFVVPFDVLEGRQFLVSGGGNGGTQYEIEAGYYFPLTDNIAIMPAFYAIGNPNNFDDNPTVFSGTVRTQFSF